jgi:DNA repair ATPase RecN
MKLSLEKVMKSFNEFLEDNKDALNKALAMHKFKKKGGKIDKQPPSLDRVWTRFSNASTLSKDDQEKVKAIAQYRKDKKMKAKVKPTNKTYGRSKRKK